MFLMRSNEDHPALWLSLDHYTKTCMKAKMPSYIST